MVVIPDAALDLSIPAPSDADLHLSPLKGFTLLLNEDEVSAFILKEGLIRQCQRIFGMSCLYRHVGEHADFEPAGIICNLKDHRHCPRLRINHIVYGNEPRRFQLAFDSRNRKRCLVENSEAADLS